MKFSLMENDKSTVMDELILGLISIGCLVLGILLIVFRPDFWVIEQNISIVTGVLIVMTGVMFVPCLIYRLLTNDKVEK